MCSIFKVFLWACSGMLMSVSYWAPQTGHSTLNMVSQIAEQWRIVAPIDMLVMLLLIEDSILLTVFATVIRR